MDPKGGVWVVQNCKAGFKDQHPGPHQEVKGKEDHVRIAREAVKLALSGAFKKHTEAMKELSDSFQLWDAFEKSFGKTGVALAGVGPIGLKPSVSGTVQEPMR